MTKIFEAELRFVMTRVNIALSEAEHRAEMLEYSTDRENDAAKLRLALLRADKEIINARAQLGLFDKSGAAELRYNPYHDPTNGRFTNAGGGSFGGKFAAAYSNGGAKGLTNSGKSGKIKKPKISPKERARVSHQIATDFPNLKADGEKHYYANRNHRYEFTVNEFGDYNFLKKKKIK